MPTPDDIYSGINQRMQEAMKKLREGGGAVADKTKNSSGGSFEPLQRGLAGMNPVTSIGSMMQQASPHIKKAADSIGGAINQPGVREWTNDKAINAIAGTNPVTGALMLGAQGSRLVNAQESKSKLSSTAVETPTQNPESPTNSAEVPALGGGAYTTMGVKYDSATGQAINPNTGTTSSGGYSIDPKTSGRTDFRGGETRVSPTNVVQKGTSTSPAPMTMDEANKLLSGGYTMNQQYASNQLPTTASSPYAGKSNAQIYNPDTLHQHTSDVDYLSLSKNLFEDRSGVANYERGKNMKADYKQMDVNPGESVPEEKINWANRTMADNSDAKLARRRAFLDAEGSMQGLRRSEAVQGMTYGGGKHYIADGKGGDNLVEMGNKDDVRTYKSGEEGARAMRDKYVNALTSKGDSVEYQTDAPAPLPDAVPHKTSIDNNPHDTKDLLNMNPGKSIIGNNTPYTSTKKGSVF